MPKQSEWEKRKKLNIILPQGVRFIVTLAHIQPIVIDQMLNSIVQKSSSVELKHFRATMKIDELLIDWNVSRSVQM